MSRRRLPAAAPEESASGEAPWLCTFNDLMTLLMVFFVLLFTMSSVKSPLIKEFQRSLQSGLGVLESGGASAVAVHQDLRPDVQPGPPDAEEDESPEQVEVEAVTERIARRLESLLGAESIERTADGHLRLKDNLLFSLGSAELNRSGYPVLAHIADELRGNAVRVRIEGHTDNVPVRSGVYESNWDLSTGRAVNVLKYLVENGPVAPERLSAAGYGDAKPCAPNDSEGNRARNRRVEIVLLKGNWR
jgi:chemotaxis protein MotB